MSLVRLLTSGKSLVDLRNSVSRYRMRHKNPLPKLGSSHNPFLGRAAAMDGARASAPSVEPSANVKAPEPVRATSAVPALATVPAVPAVPAAQSNAQPASQTVPRQAGSRWSWLTRLNPARWFARRPAPVRNAFQSVAPAHVQAELSLENVKVVRNDLSDADVEVVAAKAPSKAPVKSPVAPVVPERSQEELAPVNAE